MDGVILSGRVYSILRPSRIRNEYVTTRVFVYVEIENPSTRSQVKLRCGVGQKRTPNILGSTAKLRMIITFDNTFSSWSKALPVRRVKYVSNYCQAM
ncbi:MAG: hypothetical protein WBP88_12630 [Nitrososphaeraceae archaeon]